MAKKRARTEDSHATRLAEAFEDLASLDETIRLKAAHDLIGNFVAISDNEEQLDEILRRLINGLCSSRKSARLGFSVALSEALSIKLKRSEETSSYVSDLCKLVDVIKEHTRVGSNASSQVN